MSETLVRLQKFIADSGVCSRRNAETLITEGRIVVNGKTIITLGTKVDPQKDWIKLDGKRIQPINSSFPLVYMLNKPKFCVCTLFDPQGRETIKKYFPPNAPRLFPVGRLDYDTEGLLLLTNEGNLAQKIAHPSGEVWKTYLVKIKGILKQTDISTIRSGVKWRGKLMLPAQINVLSIQGDKSWLELKLREGKNHQIKNIFFALEYPVLKIKRIQIAGLSLGSLKVGATRKLSGAEISRLSASVQKV